MANPPIVNRNLMVQMVNLLDLVYHWGVRDAYRLNDDGAAIEYLERHKKVGVYGFLGSIEVDVIEWQLRLKMQAKELASSGSIARFFEKMNRYGANYLSAFIPLAQKWYSRGVQDYYSAPFAVDYNEFKNSKRVDWTIDGMRKYELLDAVERIQLDCFELLRRDKEHILANIGNRQEMNKALAEHRYMMFIRVVGLCKLRKA